MENYYLQIIYPDVGTPPTAAGWNSLSGLELISVPWEVPGQISAPKSTFMSLGKHKVKPSCSAVIYTSSSNLRSSWIDNPPVEPNLCRQQMNEWNVSVASLGWASWGAEQQRKWSEDPSSCVSSLPQVYLYPEGILFSTGPKNQKSNLRERISSWNMFSIKQKSKDTILTQRVILTLSFCFLNVFRSLITLQACAQL